MIKIYYIINYNYNKIIVIIIIIIKFGGRGEPNYAIKHIFAYRCVWPNLQVCWRLQPILCMMLIFLKLNYFPLTEIILSNANRRDFLLAAGATSSSQKLNVSPILYVYDFNEKHNYNKKKIYISKYSLQYWRCFFNRPSVLLFVMQFEWFVDAQFQTTTAITMCNVFAGSVDFQFVFRTFNNIQLMSSTTMVTLLLYSDRFWFEIEKN